MWRCQRLYVLSLLSLLFLIFSAHAKTDCIRVIAGLVSPEANVETGRYWSKYVKPGSEMMLELQDPVKGSTTQKVIYLGHSSGVYTFNRFSKSGAAGNPVQKQGKQAYFLNLETKQVFYVDDAILKFDGGKKEGFPVGKATCQGQFGSCAAHGVFHSLTQLNELGLLPAELANRMERMPFSPLYRLVHSAVNAHRKKKSPLSQDEAIDEFFRSRKVPHEITTHFPAARAHLDSGKPVLFSILVGKGKANNDAIYSEKGVEPFSTRTFQPGEWWGVRGSHMLVAYGRFTHKDFGTMWLVRNSWEGGNLILIPERKIIQSLNDRTLYLMGDVEPNLKDIELTTQDLEDYQIREQNQEKRENVIFVKGIAVSAAPVAGAVILYILADSVLDFSDGEKKKDLEVRDPK